MNEKEKLKGSNNYIPVNENDLPIKLIHNNKKYEIKKTKYGMQMIGVKDIDKQEKI